jgi:RNA polymerase sigma-70 factor (ECF subfamily)
LCAPVVSPIDVTLTRRFSACQRGDGMGDPVEPPPGDVQALRAALPEARAVLIKLARRLCQAKHDADDLVHDTIERAIRSGLPADVHSPCAWLTTMMHHLFIDRCRAAARAPVHQPIDDERDQLDNITPIEIDAIEPAWSRTTLDDVRAALGALAPEFRDVYTQHTFEHRSYEVIAARLKISRVTVGTRLTRARKMLRKELAKRLPPGDRS